MDPRVLEAMTPYFLQHFGNAASRNHPFGWEAEEAVDYAREQVAKLIGADPKEIIFTSGATEGDNLGIKGVYEMYASKGNHIITATTEHKAVLDTCKHIEKTGGEVTYLQVNADGTQAVGKIPVDVNKDGIDLMAFTAHKMYGPKGVGALYVRRKNPRVKVTAQLDGGGHERGMRSGTLNVPGIVGFGKACELCMLHMEAYVNGSSEYRLPHVANISFKHVEGEGLLMGFNKNIALSSGSACTSASLEPSYVLKALGLGDDLAHSSLRFGLSRFTTDEEIEYTIKAISETVLKLREMSPLWEMYKEGIDLNSIVWAAH